MSWRDMRQLRIPAVLAVTVLSGCVSPAPSPAPGPPPPPDASGPIADAGVRDAPAPDAPSDAPLPDAPPDAPPIDAAPDGPVG